MTASLLEQLADLPKAKVDALIRAMAPGEANALEYDWRYRARYEQLPPDRRCVFSQRNQPITIEQPK